MRFCSFVTSAALEADRRDVTQEWFSYAAPGAGQTHDIESTGLRGLTAGQDSEGGVDLGCLKSHGHSGSSPTVHSRIRPG
jgi:hypothetical protein